MHLDFMPDTKPHSSRPFPIPQAYRILVKEEVNRLVEIGLLTKVEASEGSSPSFAIPKKNDTIRFVTDFRVLNSLLRRKPYHLPLIHKVLHNLGLFRFATFIDLNMGYYSMKLDAESRKKCVTCLPWGLYAYNMLPMGLKIASDVFQEATGELFHDMEQVVVYIEGILIIGTDTFDQHMKVVDEVLRRLKEKGMQVNAKKSS